MTDSAEQARNKELPGPMHLLQTVYLRLRLHCEAIDEAHEREASLPVDSRGGGRLPVT
jgi:hypothetical protein